MDNKDFKDLVDGYLNDSLGTEELKELFKRLRNSSDDDRFRQIIDEALESNSFSGLADKERYNEYFDRIIKSAEAQGSIVSKKSPELSERRGILPLWSKLAIAASFLLLVSFGSIWMMRNLSSDSKITTGAAVTQVNDIAPGGNRALLTLSDGSTIILDSARNGLLAQQASTRVIKLSDGELAYSTSGKGKSERLFNTIRTPRGGQYNLLLPDSSRVWLNAESSIRFPVSFSGKNRNVEITGEAYFEVKKMPDMPFIVSCRDTRIEVTGTSFDVRTYDDEAESKTALMSGSVRIASGTGSVMLNPGQQALVGRDGRIAVEENFNADEVIAWKNGLFMFNSATIEQIMNEVGRWYNVEIEFQGERTGKTFTGIISRTSNVSKLLDIIGQAGIKYSITEEKIVVEMQ